MTQVITNYFKRLWFLALMTPHLIQICFYFKNRSFLFLIVQSLLFMVQLHQVLQHRIPKKTLFITNMIWRMNGLNNWMQNCKLWNLSLEKNYIWWKKWLKIYKVKKQHQITQ